jgi:hypothetical protein
MYREFLRAAVVMMALASSAAVAADLPTRKAPQVFTPPPPLPYSWTVPISAVRLAGPGAVTRTM